MTDQKKGRYGDPIFGQLLSSLRMGICRPKIVRSVFPSANHTDIPNPIRTVLMWGTQKCSGFRAKYCLFTVAIEQDRLGMYSHAFGYQTIV
ncbi:hypothetical protein BDN70DRAFT_888726 [Pholiota conissans]|uniref:Uncharacterized protein n=1 Tax=Pholiota conissans TaxID=109636 RepID=A0A9P5YLI4_9AGAR|nr:hypothetical protein BDN70DRAFT_888726 [Pholiota conissans]